MAQKPRYYMLIASLPPLPQLFTSDQTPISRFRLDRRLDMLEPEDREELAEIEDLMRWDRLPLEIKDAEILARADETIPRIRSHTLREVAKWRLEVRTVVAGLRRRAMGKAPPVRGERWGYGRWVRQMEQKWTASDFGLGGVMPWVTEFSRYMEEGDTLGFERQLLDLAWRYMSRAADGHYFSYEAVVLYVLRWDIIARWTAYSGETAQERFGRLVSEGLGEYAELFGGRESGATRTMTTTV
jgi:hypothetical protein